LKKFITFYLVFFILCLHLSAQDFIWETYFEIDTVKPLYGQALKLHKDRIMVGGLSQGEEMGSFFCSLLSFSKDGNNQWYRIIKKEKPNFYPVLGNDNDNIAVYSTRPKKWDQNLYGDFTLQTDIYSDDGHPVYDNNDTTVLANLRQGFFIPLENKVVYFSQVTPDSIISYIQVSLFDTKGKFLGRQIIDTSIISDFGTFYPSRAEVMGDGSVMLFGDNEYGQPKKRIPFLFKFNKDLKKQWMMTYSDTANIVSFRKVKQLPDGYVVLFSLFNSLEFSTTSKAMFIDDKGEIKSTLTLNYRYELIYNDFVMDKDGNYIFAGCQNCLHENALASFVIEKRNPDMDTLWTKAYNTDRIHKQINKILRDEDGSYIIVGDYNRQLYLAKFTDNTLGAGDIAAPVNAETILGNSPNPFGDETSINYTLSSSGNVRLSVLDVFGRTVSELANGYMDSGSHTVSFQSGDNPAGVYYIVLDQNGRKTTSKMVVIK
jgi:hypothetical protein